MSKKSKKNKDLFQFLQAAQPQFYYNTNLQSPDDQVSDPSNTNPVGINFFDSPGITNIITAPATPNIIEIVRTGEGTDYNLQSPDDQVSDPSNTNPVGINFFDSPGITNIITATPETETAPKNNNFVLITAIIGWSIIIVYTICTLYKNYRLTFQPYQNKANADDNCTNELYSEGNTTIALCRGFNQELDTLLVSCIEIWSSNKDDKEKQDLLKAKNAELIKFAGLEKSYKADSYKEFVRIKSKGDAFYQREVRPKKNDDDDCVETFKSIILAMKGAAKYIYPTLYIGHSVKSNFSENPESTQAQTDVTGEVEESSDTYG